MVSLSICYIYYTFLMHSWYIHATFIRRLNENDSTCDFVLVLLTLHGQNCHMKNVEVGCTCCSHFQKKKEAGSCDKVIALRNKRSHLILSGRRIYKKHFSFINWPEMDAVKCLPSFPKYGQLYYRPTNWLTFLHKAQGPTWYLPKFDMFIKVLIFSSYINTWQIFRRSLV